VYVVLSFGETETEPYFVDELGVYQNKYVQDNSALGLSTVAPSEPAIELARVLLGAGASEINDAADPNAPGVNEIDQRYRPRSGLVSLGLADLGDVSADEAAAFNGMNAPSVANPVATLNDVAGSVAPLEAEVAAARGAAPSIDARLDVSLDESGAIKQTAGPYPEVIQARGSQVSLSAQ